jgi:hypothetical protein
MCVQLQAVVPQQVQQLLPVVAAAAMHGLQLLAPAVADGLDLRKAADVSEALGMLGYMMLTYVSKPFPEEDMPRQLALVAGPGRLCGSCSVDGFHFTRCVAASKRGACSTVRCWLACDFVGVLHELCCCHNASVIVSNFLSNGAASLSTNCTCT